MYGGGSELHVRRTAEKLWEGLWKIAGGLKSAVGALLAATIIEGWVKA